VQAEPRPTGDAALMQHSCRTEAELDIRPGKTNGHLPVAVVCEILYLPFGRTPTPWWDPVDRAALRFSHSLVRSFRV